MNRSFRCARTGDGQLDLLVCEPLEDQGVPHGFSLRWRRWRDGRGAGAFGLRGHGEGDRASLARAIGLSRVARMRQVHGHEVRALAAAPPAPPACDGLATAERDLALVVSTADCVPLILWDAERPAAAVVHAGWRGVLADIAGRAMERLTHHFGSRPDSVHAALGPSIGVCCYEVGDDVVALFESRFPAAAELFADGRRRRHLDLIEANRRQLRQRGVPSHQVYSADMCTVCENDRLYSYRKEGNGVGRIMGVVGIRDRTG